MHFNIVNSHDDLNLMNTYVMTDFDNIPHHMMERTDLIRIIITGDY